MDSLIGLVGKDFVLLAADTSSVRSVLRMKDNEDKIIPLDTHKLLATAGEVGDRTHFSEYIQRNIILKRFQTGLDMTNHAAANFMREELSFALRRGPYFVDLLFGGYDKEQGPALYFLDYLGSMHKTEFSAQGYASYFVISTLDKYYKPEMDLDEALKVLEKCFHELQTRFIINSSRFVIKVVGKDGIKTIRGADISSGERMLLTTTT